MKHLSPNRSHEGSATKSDHGYALLLAVLIINIILAMSLGIFSISLKELILASFLKDSQKAFSAADRAMECALYWDRAYPQNGMPYTIFPTSSAYVDVPLGSPDIVLCDGVHIRVNAESGWVSAPLTATDGTTNFTMQFGDGTCSSVTSLESDNEVTLTSNGYSSCDTSNPRRTQRTIQVTTEY